MKKLFCFFIILAVLFNFCSCIIYKTYTNNTVQVNSNAENIQTSENKSDKKEISIICAGDLMFHMPIINSARNGYGYDFSYIFSDIKFLIESSDIAIANLETTIYPKRKLSGYPRFNSPKEILEGIKYAGFDVLTTANNHCADSGKEGIISTVKYLKDYGIIPVGTGDLNESKYAVIEKNDIKVGIISYTFSTNGLLCPEGMVNKIDLKKIKSDIDTIKNRCDFLMAFLHIGTEYKREVEADVQKLFYDIAEMGVDCIIGGHPHVVRKSEVIDINGRKVFVSYSLGNFLSSQNDRYTDIGILAKLYIVKENDKTRISNSNLIPVYTLRYKQNGKNAFKIVQCSDAKSSEFLSNEKKEYINNIYNDIMNNSKTAVFK